MRRRDPRQTPRLVPVLTLFVAACLQPTNGPIPNATTTPTAKSVTASPAESELVWPAVTARDFIHRPRGLVTGVPISFPDSMYCDCALVNLHDGRVFMVGSGHSTGYAAWIWDPDTGKWGETDSPTSQLSGGHADSVALDDGRVLAVLDTSSFPNARQLEIFDPVEDSFRSLEFGWSNTLIPNGTKPVLMGDGRVLLATSPQSGSVFDPSSETLTPVGSEFRPDIGTNVLGAVSLPDGRVLVVGYKQASVYDPHRERFDRVHPVHLPESGVAMARLHDGRVLLAGGESWSFESNRHVELGSADAQVFDPTTNRFTATAPLLEPLSDHVAVTMTDGQVAIIGGDDARVEVFDPETGLFRQTPELSTPRESPSVVGLQDGSILVVGGHREDFTPLDWTTPRSAEIYRTNVRPGGRGKHPEEALSGFTLGLKPDIDWQRIEIPPSGNIALSVTVPPGGFEGASYVAALWEVASPLPDQGGVTWQSGDGQTLAFMGEGHLERQLPSHCQMGCEIRETMFESKWVATWSALHLHIQYQGEIPAEAAGITLTVVEGSHGH